MAGVLLARSSAPPCSWPYSSPPRLAGTPHSGGALRGGPDDGDAPAARPGAIGNVRSIRPGPRRRPCSAARVAGQLWLFWVAPLVGAAIAGLVFRGFRPTRRTRRPPLPVTGETDDEDTDERADDEAGDADSDDGCRRGDAATATAAAPVRGGSAAGPAQASPRQARPRCPPRVGDDAGVITTRPSATSRERQ